MVWVVNLTTRIFINENFLLKWRFSISSALINCYKMMYNNLNTIYKNDSSRLNRKSLTCFQQ